MLVELNKCKYNIQSNEFNVITHNEYNNLQIRENVGLFDRIVSLLHELSKVKIGNEIQDKEKKQCIFYDVTHGGYIPINCASKFETIHLINNQNKQENQNQNQNQYQKDNITENMLTHNVKNAFWSLPPNLNLSNSIIVADKHDSIDHTLIEVYNPIMLTTLSPKILKQSPQLYEHIFELTDTNLFLYIPERYIESFKQVFQYFINITESKCFYDNMIHLCIMVKNGGHQFEDMLTQNMHLIDKWTILDTGSSDDTIDIINRVLTGKKKGELFQESFINFRDSRNRLLELAGQDCKYTLMLDDTYIIKGDLRAFLNEIRGDQTADSFTLYIKSDDVEYGSNRILKTDRGLKYKFKIHEVIQSENNMNVVIPFNRAHIFDGRFDYMEERTMGRKELDLKLLYEEVEDDPDNPRTYYYLAQTYSLLTDYDKAFYYFIERMNHPVQGFIQEKIDAIFEGARLANFQLNKPWSGCEELYLKAFNLDNSRPDALYFIGIHYYLENNFSKAFGYFKKAFEIGYPIHCQYSLKPTLSYHFLPKFLCKICYELNEYELGLKASELFLKNNKPDTDSYTEIVSWYKIYEKLTVRIEKTTPKVPEKPILCFHADGGFNNWSGSSILTIGVGGSETYIIELSRHIQKSGKFDVYVFCNCLEEEKFEGVIYRPLSQYYSFINENYIHSCIVSRFSEYLPVTFKGWTENVYFVIHDLTPSGIVIPLDKKLKKVFCLTEWHVDYFTQIFPSLKHITVPFYYGIDFNKFNKTGIQIKESYKFIYSSFPNRGLLPLLQMWPKIYEFQPVASLHIYCDVNGEWVNKVEGAMMTQIKELLESYRVDKHNMNIYYHGWVNKQILAESWLTADIWFYPCTFMETFCLTALEAAITNTFVITNHLAALENTVADRGVIIKGDANNIMWQEQALTEIKKYLDPSNIHLKNEFIERNYEWAKNLSWENQAKKMLDDHILQEKLEYKGMYNWTNNLPFNNDSSNSNSNNSSNNLTIQNYYWGPNTSINKIIENYCLSKNYKHNLEIGPGKIPFKLATDFIGCNETITNYIDIDIDKDIFPQDNNSFDFIYCRHVLEDIQNPDFTLSEIFRVSKFGGYIETPSPLIEITKNVDGSKFAYKYCGYAHHRYIVWSNIQKNEVYFLPKYSCILDHMLDITEKTQHQLYNLINNYPVYWNNYFLFDSKNKPTVIMYKNGVNFNITGRTMIEDYIQLVSRAMNESIENTKYFIQTYKIEND
jgi:TPR repeat protein